MSSAQTDADTSPTKCIRFLEQQLRDLEQQLRSGCSSSVTAQVQHMQQLAAVGKSLQLKDAEVVRLSRQVNELQNAFVAERQRAGQLQNACVAEHQRAAQLQRVLDNGAAQIQGERELARARQQQIQQQQAAFSEATTRFMEQRRRDHENQERLQRTVEQLRMELQERTRALTNCHKDTHDVSLAHLRERETVLTCPVLHDLFDDPVVSECCGKTFSFQAVKRKRGQSLPCPFCQARDVRLHPNRDMALLVELHRLERSLIGVSDVAAPSFSGIPANDDAEGEQNNTVPSERSRASHQRNVDGSTRHSRQRERRSQRLLERTAVCPRRNDEAQRHTRSTSRRRQSSSNSAPEMTSTAASVDPLNTFASWLEKNGQRKARERMARHRQTSNKRNFTSWDELQRVVDGSGSEG